jgi:hypothetical protein
MFCNMNLDPIRDAAIGVFAFVDRRSRPAACAVTPYVVDGHVVVTSTLAYPGKARAVRADERVALLAGGTAIEGRGVVGIDRTPSWFDRNLRDQELGKYPPAVAVLSVPGHRRLFPWYVGRVVIAIEGAQSTLRPTSDRVSVAVIDHGGRLQLLPQQIAVPGEGARSVALSPEVPDGAAVLLAHHESADLGELHQTAHHGTVHSGTLHIERTVRTDLGGGGTLAQLRTARALARLARAGAPSTADWPPPPVG